MTDPAAPTDEELAIIEFESNLHGFANTHDAVRLIAALRASRAEVERLRAALEPGKASAIVAAMFDQAERLGHDPYSSKHALTYLVEEVERLREDARENYVRAEQAEQALMPLRAQAERLRAVADDLAIALHQCAAFLPPLLNGEEGRKKLDRALDVNNQVDAALSAYCVVTETRRQALNNRTVKG